ncbi:MAG: H-NS histone family protein [Deltaproteobacteria bacterium ADurb.Bin510]|nr:MAG: H-NS histone family protein [Deltaproteobacteria bacterium ADurb.Bin510]
MEKYQDVVAKIAELQRQAEDLKKQERKAVIKEVRAVKAKYRNPATGETWSGRGIAPRWLQEAEKAGKSRDSFLI